MIYNGKFLTIGGVFCAAVFVLAGCSPGRLPQSVHELRFSLDRITDVTISYDEETVTFLESDSGELVIREYMTENREAYHARVLQRGEQLLISEGGKPLLKGNFQRYVEVYLPASYGESLTVTTTDGGIDLSNAALSLSTLRINSTSGLVKIAQVSAETVELSSTRGVFEVGRLDAPQIVLKTTSGKITCESLKGNVAYESTSGDLEIKSAHGSGTYQASNSGLLKVAYSRVNGDLYFYNKNDDVLLTLPEGLECYLKITTKNGTVDTAFREFLVVDGGTMSGTVGERGEVSVRVETRNGDIVIGKSVGNF